MVILLLHNKPVGRDIQRALELKGFGVVHKTSIREVYNELKTSAFPVMMFGLDTDPDLAERLYEVRRYDQNIYTRRIAILSERPPKVTEGLKKLLNIYSADAAFYPGIGGAEGSIMVPKSIMDFASHGFYTEEHRAGNEIIELGAAVILAESPVSGRRRER